MFSKLLLAWLIMFILVHFYLNPWSLCVDLLISLGTSFWLRDIMVYIDNAIDNHKKLKNESETKP